MPRFDLDGNVIAGYSQVSYNKQVIYPGQGGKAWSYSGDAVVANVQMPDGSWQVATLWLEGGPPIAEGPGANFLAGGNSRWLASNPGSGMYGALTSKTGREGVLGASLSGDLAYKDYPSGLGLTIESYGIETTVADAAVQDIQVLGPGQAIWYEGAGKVRVVGIPQPVFALTPEKVRRAVYRGEVWLCYWSPQVNRVVAHIDGQTTGYFLTTAGAPAYNRDLVATRDDRLLACWSATQGEAPGDIVVLPIDTSQPRVSLVPVVVPPHLDAPSRPVWFGFYEFQTSPQGPGSCAALVRNCAGSFPRPVIVDGESLNCLPGNLILGQLVAEASIPATEALAAQIAATQRPIAYWDDNVWPTLPALPAGSWITQRMYHPLTQAFPDFAAAMDAQVARLGAAGYPVVLVPQVFDTNTTLDPYPFPDVLQLAFDLASKYPHVVGVLGFSGFGRHTDTTGGLDAHPDWLHACEVVAPQVSAPLFEAWVPQVPPPDPGPTPSPGGFVPPPAYHLGGSMLTEKGGIVGPGGKFGRMGSPNTGPWGSLGRGWRGLIFDGDPNAGQGPTGDYEFTLTEIAPGQFTCVDTATGSFFGIDASHFSGGVDAAYYGKPSGEGSGAYEQPFGYVLLNGVTYLVVGFGPGEQQPFPFAAVGVTWVKQ